MKKPQSALNRSVSKHGSVVELPDGSFEVRGKLAVGINALAERLGITPDELLNNALLKEIEKRTAAHAS